MSGPRVVIVGGGLAGMASAVALESVGVAVTLVEARKFLGGRAGSFQDPQTGELLDNCQHVLLGCCTNLIDFYRRLGVLDRIGFHRAIHFRDERGRRFDLAGTSGVPAPVHLATSLLRFNALSWRDRAALSRAMLAMMRLGRDGRTRLADTSFGDWLNGHAQPESLVRRFYDAIIVSALNEETRRASAEYAIAVFQDSLLAHAEGYVIGIPTCTLGELYAKFPCCDVRLGARMTALRFSRSDVTGIELTGGETIYADAIVLATNHHAITKWLPDKLVQSDARFAGLEQLQSVPILGAHLWFDRPVMSESHDALITGPLQWIFRKDESGAAVHGVISAARAWVDRSKDEMLRLFESQLRDVLPAARRAKLVRGVIVIEKRATFSPVPGVERYRPSQAPPPGGIQKLFLAGDYTQTGWPATMEGAVRSGYLAAQAVLTRFAPNAARRSFLVGDLSPQWPARVLGRRASATDSR
jgi:zeta-carotene desaturase